MTSSFDLFNEFLLEKFGPDALERDGDNQISLAVNDFLILFHYFPGSEKLLIASCIAPLPRENRENLLLRLLQGQYFFHKTAGMTLSVDKDGTFIALQTCVDAHALSSDDFFTILDNFVHVAEFWAKECAKNTGDSVSGAEQTEDQLACLTQWIRA